MNVIDKVFGVSPQVLAVRSRRTELIAANLANADTPGYKARDIDFRSAMIRAQSDFVSDPWIRVSLWQKLLTTWYSILRPFQT